MRTPSIPRNGRPLGPLAALALLALPVLGLAQPDTPLIDTRSSSSASNIDSETLRNVPSARDPWSVLSAAPGVSPGQEVSVSGASSLMTIDGITVGNPADLGSSQSYIDFNAIQEVQVQTGGSGAEYGRDAIGGVIQIVTKDGTREWNGSGQVLGGSGDASSQAFANGRFEVMVQEEADGGYCMESFQFLSGGTPVQPDGPLSIGFDQGFSIGADPSSQTPVSAGKRFTIEPCPGAETGMSFVDSPTPVTPPTPTHLYFGQNGVFAVDMNRVAALYGVKDPGVFDRSFFLNGPTSFTNERFQQLPGVVAQPTAGSGNALYLYGIDPGGQSFAAGAPAGGGFPRNPYAVQLQGGTPALPDADGDGKGDSYFIQFSGLQSACPNALGGVFTTGTGGTAGGGALQPDAGAARPDCDYLKDWGSLSRDFQLSSGLRYDFQGGAKSPVFGAGDAGGAARTGGAFRTNFQVNEDLGGPIIRDRLWIWGSYGEPDTDREQDEKPLFSSGYYEGVNLAEWYADRMYTPAAVRSAPAGRGVQDVALELQTMENADGLPIDYTPGGAIDATEGWGMERTPEAGIRFEWADAPLFYVVAQGGPTGEVFQVEMVHPASGPVAIDGLVALEPVAATAEDRDRFEQELERAGGTRETLTAAGYCLQMVALAPPAGTVFRVAPAEKQARYAPMRRALDAARRLRDAGQLHPDSDPAGYYHSIRQWAAWTVERGFDREGFLDAFVERTEENFRDAGQPWSEDVAAAVRSYGEGRWTDIRAILDAAETTAMRP